MRRIFLARSEHGGTTEFELRGAFIALNDLLKLVGACDSGGAGKALVAAGSVQVDGAHEMRKTCKIRPGQRVQVAGFDIRVTKARDPVEGDEPSEGASA